MKTVNKPFERILGNTKELRILERLIASPNIEFNTTDLGKMTGVSRDSATKAIENLTRWNILSFTERMGNMDFYKLNSEEPMVMAIKAFNDSIIIRLFPEVSDALEEMEKEQNHLNHELNIQTGPFVSTILEPCFPTHFDRERVKKPIEIAKAW
jgi:DNA-binding transcriptional ArsR family regulator